MSNNVADTVHRIQQLEDIPWHVELIGSILNETFNKMSESQEIQIMDSKTKEINYKLDTSMKYQEISHDGNEVLNSETNIKILLKCTRDRTMLKLVYTQHDYTEKLLHTTLPEEQQPVNSLAPALETPKPTVPGRRQAKKLAKKQKKQK